MNQTLRQPFLLLWLVACTAQVCVAADWSVPLAGNAFERDPSPERRGFARRGTLAWSDTEAVYSVYFHADRSAILDLAFRGRADQSGSTLAVQVGSKTFRTKIEGEALKTQPIGRVEISGPGYVRVDFQGEQRGGPVFAEISDLLVKSPTTGLALDYVKTNDGNMFYWGRRGPSVHLRYEVPKEKRLRYAYSEVTVPRGQDPIGSFFMANGFGEGYFGIQVNGPQERRILFSVWSPFKTDNPRDIPEDQRIVTLGKGRGVRVGEFGNEGSGGQSFLVHRWESGVTYRFLTEVSPDGQGSTIYTSWFSSQIDETWQLIASFRRPKTETPLRGFHSFLENFAPSFGHVVRRGNYGNVWVCDVDGGWHACAKARFSVDATGRGRHRLDFTGGAEGESFFLRNGGFFDESGRPGEVFTRQLGTAGHPEIRFDALPRN